jgi:hypothetical protein
VQIPSKTNMAMKRTTSMLSVAPALDGGVPLLPLRSHLPPSRGCLVARVIDRVNCTVLQRQDSGATFSVTRREHSELLASVMANGAILSAAIGPRFPRQCWRHD